jgi:recombinational DNA repair protein RecR
VQQANTEHTLFYNGVIDCVLDFFYVNPGDGVGVRSAEAIMARLKQFNIQHMILATVSDNGSDALSAGSYLSNMLNSEHLRYS